MKQVSDQLARRKVVHEREISFEEVEFWEVLRKRPLDVLEYPILDLFLIIPHLEESQLNHTAVGILMLNPGDFVADDGIDSQFFIQLAT